MIYTEYKDAASFLAVAREALERQEAANGLMLGVCGKLVEKPDAYGGPAYMATVESDGALRVAAVMTPPFDVQVYLPDGEDRRRLELVADGLLRGRWPVPGVIAQRTTAEAFASVWCRRTGARSSAAMSQGVYELRKVTPPPWPVGHCLQATVEHAALLRQWARGFHRDCFGDDRCERSVRPVEEGLSAGNVFLWIDETPRAMALRTRPTAHGEAIGGVFTPPEHRRKGYATALVARLSQLILDSGKQFCTLYTDLSNPTSNGIYRKIGYRQVADSVDIRCEPGPPSP